MGDSTWIRENDAQKRGKAALTMLSKPSGASIGVPAARTRTVTAEDEWAKRKKVLRRRAKKKGK